VTRFFKFFNAFFRFFSSFTTTFRTAPGAARVGSFLFFLASVADGTLMPFFPLWAHRDAGIPVEYIGLLLGCYAGGELLATPFVGGIADRVGRRPVLLASTTGIGLGFVLLFFASGAIAIAPPPSSPTWCLPRRGGTISP
jgi:MFS family permease